jgi:accessory colonization factor AcfC
MKFKVGQVYKYCTDRPPPHYYAILKITSLREDKVFVRVLETSRNAFQSWKDYASSCTEHHWCFSNQLDIHPERYEFIRFEPELGIYDTLEMILFESENNANQMQVKCD